MAQIEVKGWFAKKSGLRSNLLEVTEITNQTDRAVQLVGSAVYAPSSTCWRCGREITRPESLSVGVGPDCADALGIPWREDADSLARWGETEGVFSGWVPRSVIFRSDEEFRDLLKTSQFKDPTDVKAPIIEASETIQQPAKFRAEGDSSFTLWTEWLGWDFISGAKNIPGRTWLDGRKLNKYPLTSLLEAVEFVERWGLKTDLDEPCSLALAFQRAEKDAREEFAKSHGADDLQALKEMDLEHFEWDRLLKTSPWAHQRQSIIFAAGLLGLSTATIEHEQE